MVAVVGRTNVGKSTLINRVMGEKVSIVSPLVQTTRNLIRAVLTDARGQLVWLDTPGVHRAESQLGTLMNRRARAALDGVDAVMLVMDANVPPRIEDQGWIERLAGLAVPRLLVLNKVDAGGARGGEYRTAWTLATAGASEAAAGAPAVWFEASAQTGDGIEALVQAAFDVAPVGPHLFSEDMLTDYPARLSIGDVIREKLVVGLRDEVPHAIAVLVDELDRRDDGWSVQATIYVNRPSQKGIVIGHKGRTLRTVKRQSETDLSTMFGVPVTVQLWVKVEKNWQENYWMLRQLGYAD